MSASDPPDVPVTVDFQNADHVAAWVARTVRERPHRRDFFDAFVATLSAANDIDVLELGSGPGHLAEQILNACRIRRYVLLDFSPHMHALSKQRLASFAAKTEFLIRDFRKDWTSGMAQSDVAVTMQAAHELRHKHRLPKLLAAVRERLKPGGLFLYSDHFYEDGSGKNRDLFCGCDEQRSLLEDAGFHPISEILAIDGQALLAATNPQ